MVLWPVALPSTGSLFLSSRPLLFLLGREAFTSSGAFVKWSTCATLRLLIDIGPGCLVFVAIIIVGVLGVLYVFWILTLIRYMICCCSVAQSCPTLCDLMDCSTPGFLSITNSRSLLRLMFIESLMPSNHLILCHSLLLLPSVFPIIRIFSKESVLGIRWSKYWSFSFSISSSKEYSTLISFRIYWFISLKSKGPSRVFCNTTSQKHQFFSTQLSLWSKSHIHIWLLEKP